MKNYAIKNGNRVINVIVAASLEEAQSLTDLEVFEIEDSPWIDWTLEEDGWRPPIPHPDWVWDGEKWISPEENQTN